MRVLMGVWQYASHARTQAQWILCGRFVNGHFVYHHGAGMCADPGWRWLTQCSVPFAKVRWWGGRVSETDESSPQPEMRGEWIGTNN